MFADAGYIVIAAFISPFRADRDQVRAILPAGRFIEVFVDAPLEVCESRDVKGLYAKARANQLKEFTDISSPFEPALQPEIALPTSLISAAESVVRIIDHLHRHDTTQ